MFSSILSALAESDSSGRRRSLEETFTEAKED